jgi:hypothetical protein
MPSSVATVRAGFHHALQKASELDRLIPPHEVPAMTQALRAKLD